MNLKIPQAGIPIVDPNWNVNPLSVLLVIGQYVDVETVLIVFDTYPTICNNPVGNAIGNDAE